MEKNKEIATLAAGCFWCIEEIYNELKGVETVVSGYTGGNIENPTYEQVSNGNTNHAEALQITFDPSIISYESILNIFWTMHDPTTLNAQGADVGTQYRSAVFYHGEKQKEIANKLKDELNKSGRYKNEIVTEITPFTKFYKAEEYHQKYFEKNPNQAYCKIVIDPKIAKFRKLFFENLKK